MKKKVVSFKTKSGKVVKFAAGGKKKRRGKRKISIKAIQGALKSKKTPAHLKAGLRKYLKKRMGK